MSREREHTRGLSALSVRKRASHRLKVSLFFLPALDCRLDDWLDDARAQASPLRRALREQLYLRLFPERRVRAAPFAPAGGAGAGGRALTILTLVPPEDTGGGSRPAQLAAELHRRGWRIEWRYALPIFPWPERRRPRIAGVEVRHVGEGGPGGDPSAANGGSRVAPILVEAPHPALCARVRAVEPGTRVIYDAIDLWDGALGLGWYAPGDERWLVERADRLIASSALLHEELSARSGRTVELLQNAVDTALFDPRKSRATPPDVRRGSPTVGYVGALWGEWVDLELVASLADALPAAQINLVGPLGDRRPIERPNLHWLGVKRQSEVPAYLQAFDVAIVPFAVSRLTAAVSPLKIYEYLAMERPVVSSLLPELRTIPGVRIAGSAEAFAEAVACAAREPVDRAAMSRFVAGQTWAARVDRLIELLCE
jgi:glycosyltransferase involved in cell wall biosynthesis